MSNGPHAVARSDGMVVFVRGAAPGEQVDVRLSEIRRRYAFAEVTRVVRPSDARRSTPCSLAGTCGGCPWQHLDYGEQLRFKRDLLRDQLRRLGGIDAEVEPVQPSPRVFGYRSRIKLRVDRGRIGFYAGGSHTLVTAHHCPLAESGVDRAIAAAARLARAMPDRLRRLEIVGLSSTDVFAIDAEVEGDAADEHETTCRTWLERTERCRGLRLHGSKWQREWGDPWVEVSPEPGISLRAGVAGFTQVNPEANRLLVRNVLELIAPLAGRRVLEGYSGVGNFSAPIARRGAEVTAVESAPDAVRDAERNARTVANGWAVRHGAVEKIFTALAEAGEQFDAALLDPPRSGAAAALAPLLEIAPASLVYVSCDIATLARDLGTLKKRYDIDRILPIDMFPHTYHLETVVLCRLRR